MAVEHPALPKPQWFKLTLSCGHSFSQLGKGIDIARPLMCPEHGTDPGPMVSIVSIQRLDDES